MNTIITGNKQEFTQVAANILASLGFYVETTVDQEKSVLDDEMLDRMGLDAGGVKYTLHIGRDLLTFANIDNGVCEVAERAEDDDISSIRNLLTAVILVERHP